jgi:uncharacterized protein
MRPIALLPFTAMMQSPQAETLTIEGPAGTLEALLETPRDAEPSGAVVVCHPHPQHGGTMQNKVVHTLARAFVAQGFAALRFNFRGVGGSDGEFDEGRGELEDALASARALEERTGGLPLWCAGFSFGAAIAIRAASELGAAGLISVAPALSRLDRSRQPRCPWLIVQGDRDELVDVDVTIAWVNDLDPGPELEILEGAEHFFHGRLLELRKAVEAFVAANRDRK